MKAKRGLRFVGLVLGLAISFAAQSAFASTPTSTNASLLVQQLDESGTPLNIDITGGSGGGTYASFIGQNKGPMGPFLRLKMQMVNNGTTTGALANFSNPTIPISFEIYNLSGCDMIRTTTIPTSWANDGQFHDVTWTPASTVFNPNANTCTIEPNAIYHIGIYATYDNVDYRVAADASGTPYMINSTDPIGAPPIPAATPYPAGVVWQSAPTHTDEINVIDFVGSPCCFNNTQFSNLIPLGIWDGPDFTTTASTTVHIWDRSTKASSAVFDVGLAASSGGNPFVAYPTYSTNIIFGYPYNNPFIFTTAPDATSTQEQIFPTNANITIHHGDEMWGYLVPSFAAPFYNGGDKVAMGGTGNVPQVQVCEGECNVPPPTPQYCTPGTDPDCNSNVLFLPGIEGSRLYSPNINGADCRIIDPVTNEISYPVECRLWEPSVTDNVQKLFLNPDGSSQSPAIYTKDVINEIPVTGKNVYKSFLNDLETWKNTDHIIADYTVAPYDWRLSLDDILNYGKNLDGRIYYSGDLRATSTPYIIQELRRLAASSRTGKVTIITHSNGGLVAKALLKRLQDTHDSLLDKVDTLVMVAVPQTGTPMAIGAALNGFGQALPGIQFIPSFILDEATARQFASNSPMAYHLLPSAGYFSNLGSTIATPPVTFSDGTLTQRFINAYGHVITNYTELRKFLLVSEGRQQPAVNDTQSPAVLSPTLLAYAEAKHADLDNWIPPASTTVYEIAGWGNDTLSNINYYTGKICVRPKSDGTCTQYSSIVQYSTNTVVDGDGTVVTPSALAISTSSPNVSRRWLDLDNYNRVFNISLPSFLRKSHADIFEVQSLRDFIRNNILTHTATTLPQFISTSTPVTNAAKRLHFRLHSPLALSVHDAQGREVSASTSTIPDATYMTFGEEQYVSVPAGDNPIVQLNGISSGSFTLDVDELAGDMVTASTTFAGVPSATTTQASMSFSDGTIANASPLKVDYNGDGTIDVTLAPKVGSIVSIPIPLTISAENKTMTVHGAVPVLSATLSGFVNGDTATSSDVTGSPKCTTTATASSSVGTYPIICTVGTLQSQNYSFSTFVAGTLKVLYRCDGFLDPINNKGHELKDENDDSGEKDDIQHGPSVFEMGSTVPVKFQFLDTNNILLVATTSPRWLTPQKGSRLNQPVDETLFTDPTDSGTSYVLNGSTYKYSWKTKDTSKGYWYRVYAKLGTGQLCSVTVGLK